MSVNSINATNVVNTYDTTKATAQNTTTDTTKATEKQDTYETGKSTAFNRTEAKKAIEASEQAKAESMQTLLRSMLQTQYGKYVQAMPNSNLKDYFSNLQVDEATRLQAQQDISEDGYWGVKQTSGRILDFAKALAGDDPDKLQKMKDAVEKGFKLAEDMWGGELPSISQNTYDAVMKGFDEWEKEISKKTAGVTETVASDQI